MRKTSLLLCFPLCMLLAFESIGQEKSNFIQISAGPSWHGTGDMGGLFADIGYSHSLARRLDLSNGISTSIHSKKDDSWHTAMSDEQLLRFTTAGIQLTSTLHYAVVYFSKHRLRIDGGGIARYQSTSLPDVYGIHHDPAYPMPFYTFHNLEKQNTFSVGYTFGLSYLSTIGKYQAGVTAMLQNDTNGDVISRISLIIGRSVSFK